MGAVHFSLDPRLVQALHELLPLRVFVETGTFRGDSLASARPFFDRLHSSEIDVERCETARRRFAGDAAIEVQCGSSVDFLRALAPRLASESVLYWLDAHWCRAAEDTAPAEDQCPLLDELAAIGQINERSVLLIDDARYFLAPPPPPNDPRCWPSFERTLAALRSLGDAHELSVCNDVIVFAPQSVAAPLRDALQRLQVDWLEVTHRADRCEKELLRIQQIARGAQADLAAQIDDGQALREALQSSEADRAARLEAIQQLQRELRDATAEHAKQIEALQRRLQEVEADRQARLDAIRRLEEAWQTSEADRAERLDVIHRLDALWQTSEADRAARLEVIRALEEELSEWRSSRAAKLARGLARRLAALRPRAS